MATIMRRCPTVHSQPEGAVESETNPSVPQWEEQADTIDGKVIADYEPEIDYEPEGSDPENGPDAQAEEENSNPEYAKMELL